MSFREGVFSEVAHSLGPIPISASDFLTDGVQLFRPILCLNVKGN
jgi:hypothetical protein